MSYQIYPPCSGSRCYLSEAEPAPVYQRGPRSMATMSAYPSSRSLPLTIGDTRPLMARRDVINRRLGPPSYRSDGEDGDDGDSPCFRGFVRAFDFRWFGASMGTGIVSLMLHEFSVVWSDHGMAEMILQRMSHVFFFTNVAVFATVLALTMLRYVMWPGLFVGAVLRDTSQCMPLAMLPMAFSTIVAMAAYMCKLDTGSETWRSVIWGMWWVDATMSVATAVVVPFLLTTMHHDLTDLSSMNATWLLPAIAPTVAAATGSAVASTQTNPHRALVTITTSYALLGLGLPSALTLLVLYFHRLATCKLPAHSATAAAFFPLSPLGQGGVAAQRLGAQAMRVFPLAGALPLAGETAALEAGRVLYVVGFLVALLLWGFGLLWLFMAAGGVAHRRFPFGLGWGTFTFPLGVYAISTLTMGVELPSRFFVVLGSVLGVIVVVNWLLVVVVTVVRFVAGISLQP